MREADRSPIPGKYYFFNLGCPKNLVYAERAAAQLERVGWEQAESPTEAALLVVTTCAFIRRAEEESVEEILRVASLKSREQRLAVLGCLVSREGARLKGLLPEVGLFLPVEEIDLLLLDLALPGESGMDFCRRLRSGPYGEIPVIALSAYPETIYAEKALAAGCAEFIGKPSESKTIVEAIRRLLAG